MIVQLFQDFDTDDSGYIDRNELKEFMIKLAEMMQQPVPDEKQIKMAFKLLDTNEDGRITMDEMFVVLEPIAKIMINDIEYEYKQMRYQEILEQ